MKALMGTEGVYSDFHLKRTPREIQVEHVLRTHRLGSGAFGEVWKATMDEKVPGYPPFSVALKMLNEGATKKDALALLQEAHLMAQVDRLSKTFA